MTAAAPAHLDVEGCLNFRDAGGWALTGAGTSGGTMRRGLLWRSDDPVRVTDAGRRAVAALGLAAAIDLRQHSQFVRTPGFIAAERTFHRPLVDKVIDLENPPPLSEPQHIADMYEDMIERSRAGIADVLDIVAAHLPHGPVLVHCAFGKDRTGIVIAIVQAALGVPAASIVDDYARSHGPAGRRHAWMLAEPLPDDPPIHRPPRYLFSAPPETMVHLLDRVAARHGSIAGWTGEFPVSHGTIERLRAALVEPGASTADAGTASAGTAGAGDANRPGGETLVSSIRDGSHEGDDGRG